jgi:hypothetical protein
VLMYLSKWIDAQRGPATLQSWPLFGFTAKSNSDWPRAQFVPKTPRNCGHSRPIRVSLSPLEDDPCVVTSLPSTNAGSALPRSSVDSDRPAADAPACLHLLDRQLRSSEDWVGRCSRSETWKLIATIVSPHRHSPAEPYEELLGAQLPQLACRKPARTRPKRRHIRSMAQWSGSRVG